MKRVLIVADGMADEAQEALNGLTPLQYAHTPAMDTLAREGISGRLRTIPPGYTPGSEVAMLSLLGYDPDRVFEGRAVLEAAGMGLSLQPDELALRCNLITLDDQRRIISHSAGEIDPTEGRRLIEFLDKELGRTGAHFFPGLSYRHTFLFRGGDKAIRCTPPQDLRNQCVDGYPISALRPEAEPTARELNRLTQQAASLLRHHPINRQREASGRLPANAIWFWSPGHKPTMTPLAQRYRFTRGAVVAGVPLVKGSGVCAGLERIEVPGATGYRDTDYAGKAAATIAALRDYDFILVHIEAPDECSHEGDLTGKIDVIEQIDRLIVAPIAHALSTRSDPYRLALLPDHPSLCRTRAHTSDPVPFVVWGSGLSADACTQFDELSAVQGNGGSLVGDRFAQLFFES